MAPETRGWAFSQDLEAVIDLARDDLLDLDGGRLFITGGTGFIGCWLLECLRHAEERLGLRLRTTILTRSVDAFRRKAPHLAEHRGFTFLTGDVSNFDFPDGEFTHVVHAAADASAKLNAEDPLRMFDSVIDGTRRALDFAVAEQSPAFSSTQLRRRIWPSTPGHDSCRRAMDGRAGLRRSGEFIRGGQARR